MNNTIRVKVTTAITAFLLLVFIFLILAFPKDSFEAAYSGLNIWFTIVFPSLLPFFIGSELLINLGMVDFIAVLLEPIMGPLFNCPGNSSFIWAMSITSGYPVGAKLTASLRQQGQITKVEGQRILAFCSTSGPLFMIGAVGIGLLGNPSAGRIIALSHYTAAIFIGFIFRFYGYNTSNRKKGIATVNLSTAFQALNKARQKDNRKLGELLGNAIRDSINTLLVIGGFIIIFSVIINLLIKIQFINWLANILLYITSPFGLSFELLKGIAGGIFEITIGCKLISQSSVTIMQKMVASTFLIGWSGFCIHGQVASIISKTDLSLRTYMLTKIFHGILSSLIAVSIIKIFYKDYIQAFNIIEVPYKTAWIQRFFTASNFLISVVFILVGIIILLNLFISLHTLKPIKKK